MKRSSARIGMVAAVITGLCLICSEVDARRGGGGTARASAARGSGSGSVRKASMRTTTPSRSPQQPAATARAVSRAPVTPVAAPTPTKSPSRTPFPAPDAVSRPSGVSSSSRAGLAAAAGVAAGAAGATAVSQRRENQPAGYGSVNQSERLMRQARTDPAARRAVADRMAVDPRARQAAVNQLRTDPAARAAARAYASPTTRAAASARVTAGGRTVVTTLPAHARPVRVPRAYPGRWHHWYWTGHRWYRPYYYGGYEYYEEADAPVGAEIDELPEEDLEVVMIDGQEYYVIEGDYYQRTENGFVVADPHADAQIDGEETAVALDLENSRALQVLKAMSEHLQTLDQFRIDSVETHDNVQETGGRYQLANKRRLFASKPNRARAAIQGDGLNRQFWYDGETVTVFSGVLNTYATVNAPGALPEMLAAMSTKYGLSFPLADIFFADVYYGLTEGLVTADYVGEHQAGGVLCDHLAFSQEAIDWQIWVEKGDQPVPRKIHISYKLEPGVPTYTSEMFDWREVDEEADAYRFRPPEGAVEIEMQPL